MKNCWINKRRYFRVEIGDFNLEKPCVTVKTVDNKVFVTFDSTRDVDDIKAYCNLEAIKGEGWLTVYDGYREPVKRCFLEGVQEINFPHSSMVFYCRNVKRHMPAENHCPTTGKPLASWSCRPR